MSLFSIRTSNNNGDTIVEVLVAIAIISLILAGAFVAVNRSFAGARDAEEHGEALKLAEAQIEKIKAFAALPVADPKSPFEGTTQFCYELTGVNKGQISAVIPGLASENFSVYSAECQHAPQGITYYVSVTRETSATDFTVRTRWSGLLSGNREVELKYRAFP